MGILSKVKAVKFIDSFENEYGAVQQDGRKLLFGHKYEMEDGTILQANHKQTPSPFVAGQEVEYEITGDNATHGKKGKVKKPDTGNHQNSAPTTKKPDDYQIGMATGHAVNGGIQLAISEGDITVQNIEKHSKLILALTTKMKAEWVSTSEPVKSAPQAPVSAQPPVFQDGDSPDDDDLPF